jgi:hypothetical protein
MNEFGWFMLGMAASVCLYVVWSRLLVRVAARNTLRTAEACLGTPADDAAHQKALELVQACKLKLALQPVINPSWIEPLTQVIPAMVQDIAEIFHPDMPDPLLAPKTSDFACAVELAAGDVATFLKQRRVGRLLDVSAYRAHKTYQQVRQVAEDERVSKASKAWNFLRPVAQFVGYNSPIMWATLLGRNMAIRSLQPAIVSIVGHRAIQLYSGELGADSTVATEAVGQIQEE